MIPFDPAIAFDRSPHSSSRMGHEIVGTVIHFTGGGTAKTSIEWAKNPASKCSWHFIVDRDGSTYQQVELQDAAWHAGQSEWLYKGVPTINVNRFTIGIELCNHGPLVRADGVFMFETDAGHRSPYVGPQPVQATLRWAAEGGTAAGWWEPFPQPQIAGLQKLLGMLRTRGFACADVLAGHDEVSRPRGRKLDPGPLFPWDAFGRPEGTRATSAFVAALPLA